MSMEANSRAHLSHLRWFVVLTAFLCGAYFFGGASDNQNARLDAIYAFAEPNTPDTGTFRIDRFFVGPRRPNTVDWAFHDGHFYSNKAPGPIWLGAAVYSVLIALEGAFDIPFDAPHTVINNAYIINLAVSVVPLAAGALAFFELCLALACPAPRAAWLALATSLGTLWFPYSTQLWGHATAAGFSVLAMREAQEEDLRSAALAGLYAALAVCADYLAALTAIAVSVWVLAYRPRHVLALALGASLPTLALLGYQALYFGSPFVSATQMSNPKIAGFFGQFSLGRLYQLSFGLRRGLFVQCPILMLSPAGFYAWIRRNPRDIRAYLCLGTSLAFFVANATFTGWHGGVTVGARYLICAIPFMMLALHALPWTRLVTWTANGLLALSAFNMLTVAAVNPLAPEKLANPLYQYTYDRFFHGLLTPYAFSFRNLDSAPNWRELAPSCMWNWGEKLGLNGLPSLIPLALCLGALGIWVARRQHRVAGPGTDR